MLKMLKIATAAGLLALGLIAAPAQAVPIIGTVSVSDTYAPAFLPASATSIVGDLTSLHAVGFGLTGGGTGAFGATGGLNAVVAAWIFAAPAGGPEISIPGFDFDITAAAFVSMGPLLCAGGTCHDGLLWSVSGTVTGAGFDPTLFTGSLSFTGSCLSNDNSVCASGYSGTYGYSLAATGQPTETPEPGTLALLGLGLAGLGVASRRKKI